MNARSFGLSLAATVGLFFIICTVSSQVAPVQYTQLFKSWYHVAVTKPPEATTFDIGKILLGFFTSTIVAWLMGWVWASLYNAFNGKRGSA